MSADRARIASAVAGIDEYRGNEGLIAIGGSRSPTGCTLLELAEALIEAGAVDALNCDGGGSAQVFAGSGVLLASSDARGVPGAVFDRPVPVAASVT